MNYYRTLITEDEKSRILGMHAKKGYKTINEDFDIEFNTLLTEKVQWTENNKEPYKFQDHGENIKSLQKALGFPSNLWTGNFWNKTEAAVKEKMKELNLGEYSRDAGISQTVLDSIVASPSPAKTTAELQQLQTASTAGSTTQGGTTDPAKAKSSDANLIKTMMKIDMGDIAIGGFSFRLGYDGSVDKPILSKPYKLTINLIDTSNNSTYKLDKDTEFNSNSYYNDYYLLPSELTPKLDILTAGGTYKLTVQFEDAGTVETTLKVSQDQTNTATPANTQGPQRPGTKQGEIEVYNMESWVWDNNNKVWLEPKSYMAKYNDDGTAKNNQTTGQVVKNDM
jgi:hypothetical protein